MAKRSKQLGALLCVLLFVSVVMAGCTQPSTTATSTGTQNTTQTLGESKVTFTDSNGQQVVLPKTAQRIVVTNSDCAEMLIAIGAKDKVVGASDSVFKNAVVGPNLPVGTASIGDWKAPDIEKMMVLKPDVVICYSSSSKPTNMDQILAANISVVYLDCFKMENMTSDARALGKISGNEQQADQYAGFLETYLNLVNSRVSGLTQDQKPTVYWESYSAYSTVGQGSAGNNVVALAGGNNIAGDNATAYPKVSNEWVIAKNPQFIIKMAQNTINTTDGLQNLSTEIQGRPGMRDRAAIKDNHTYVMSGGIAFGPRGVVGLLYTAKVLHPDLFKDVDPAAVQAEYAEQFLPGSNEGVFIYPVPA